MPPGHLCKTAAVDREPERLTMDRPTTIELLEIVAETLTEAVVPATATHAQHQARVAANLCRIIGRELATDATAPGGLADSLLDCDDATADAAFDDVLALVRAKLNVAKPGYDAHDAQAEADVIS